MTGDCFSLHIGVRKEQAMKRSRVNGRMMFAWLYRDKLFAKYQPSLSS
jgi:hypothetical protein